MKPKQKPCKIDFILWNTEAYNFGDAEVKAFKHMVDLQNTLFSTDHYRIRIYRIELYRVDDVKYTQTFTVYYKVKKYKKKITYEN